MKRKTSVDLFKYIAALMVVALHTTRSFGLDSDIGFAIINVICRLAVPFFAICTGYFLSERWSIGSNKDTNAFLSSVVRQAKKIAVIYVIWSFVYLIYSIPKWIEIGWFSPKAFFDYCIGAFKTGSYYHLWYLLSLLYALPLFAIILLKLSNKRIVLIALALWGIKVLSYGYRFLLPRSVVRIIAIPDSFSGLRDAIFCILPLMLAGACVRILSCKASKRNLVKFIISFGALCVEAFWLKQQGQMSTSFIVFTLPSTYYLFKIILNVEINLIRNLAVALSSISLIVYCVHPMIGELTEARILNSGMHYCFTAVLATIIGLLYLRIKKLVKGRENV